MISALARRLSSQCPKATDNEVHDCPGAAQITYTSAVACRMAVSLSEGCTKGWVLPLSTPSRDTTPEGCLMVRSSWLCHQA